MISSDKLDLLYLFLICPFIKLSISVEVACSFNKFNRNECNIFFNKQSILLKITSGLLNSKCISKTFVKYIIIKIDKLTIKLKIIKNKLLFFMILYDFIKIIHFLYNNNQ